jgi:hypothetical protein
MKKKTKTKNKHAKEQYTTPRLENCRERITRGHVLTWRDTRLAAGDGAAGRAHKGGLVPSASIDAYLGQ